MVYTTEGLTYNSPISVVTVFTQNKSIARNFLSQFLALLNVKKNVRRMGYSKKSTRQY